MKSMIVISAILALGAAVPQRRVSLNVNQEASARSDQQVAEQNYNNAQNYQAAPAQQSYQSAVAQEYKKPQETSTWIPIISQDKEQANDGSYKTSYETGNNIYAQESGYLKKIENSDSDALVQQGSYSYTAPDGQVITVEYQADETGFKAVGDHIPTPPPVSPEIQKGLDIIYAGIKANAERAAIEAKNNPNYAKEQEDRAALDYKGQYYQQ